MDDLIQSIATGHNRDHYARRLCGLLVAAAVVLLASSGPSALQQMLQTPAPAAAAR